MNVEERIVRAVAEREADRFLRRVIRALQRRTRRRLPDYVLMLEEDHGMSNAWEAICVARRHLHDTPGLDWMLEETLLAAAPRLSALAMETIWLQTTAGEEWRLSVGDANVAIPAEADSVLYYLKSRLLRQAESWSNLRIRDWERNRTF